MGDRVTVGAVTGLGEVQPVPSVRQVEVRGGHVRNVPFLRQAGEQVVDVRHPGDPGRGRGRADDDHTPHTGVTEATHQAVEAGADLAIGAVPVVETTLDDDQVGAVHDLRRPVREGDGAA